MGLSLAGPIIPGDAHTGSSDLLPLEASHAQCLICNYPQHLLQTSVTDPFLTTCGGPAKANDLAVFICDQSVAFGAANINSEEVFKHKSPLVFYVIE